MLNLGGRIHLATGKNDADITIGIQLQRTFAHAQLLDKVIGQHFQFNRAGAGNAQAAFLGTIHNFRLEYGIRQHIGFHCKGRICSSPEADTHGFASMQDITLSRHSIGEFCILVCVDDTAIANEAHFIPPQKLAHRRATRYIHVFTINQLLQIGNPRNLPPLRITARAFPGRGYVDIYLAGFSRCGTRTQIPTASLHHSGSHEFKL